MEHLTEWRDRAENPGFKKRRKIQIYHSLNKNQQKIIEWEKKNSKFHRVRRTRFNFFFFFIYFILKVIVSTSLFSATSIACILIEVFNSNMVKTLHIYTVKTDDLYTSKYSYICILYIANYWLKTQKKWDLALHSGIVEMKGNKEKKIEIYVYVLANKIDPSKN